MRWNQTCKCLWNVDSFVYPVDGDFAELNYKYWATTCWWLFQMSINSFLLVTQVLVVVIFSFHGWTKSQGKAFKSFTVFSTVEGNTSTLVFDTLQGIDGIPHIQNILHSADDTPLQYWTSSTVPRIHPYSSEYPPQCWEYTLTVLYIIHSTENTPLQYWTSSTVPRIHP